MQTPEEMLNELREKDRFRLEALREGLNERYDGITRHLKALAAMTGIDEATIVESCVHTTFKHDDLTWEKVLLVLHTFYVNKIYVERDKEQQA